jgi:hypothetical protein
MVREALEQHRHSVQAAAHQLGVSRMTLYRLLERYDIDVQRPAAKPAAADQNDVQRPAVKPTAAGA